MAFKSPAWETHNFTSSAHKTFSSLQYSTGGTAWPLAFFFFLFNFAIIAMAFLPSLDLSNLQRMAVELRSRTISFLKYYHFMDLQSNTKKY